MKLDIQDSKDRLDVLESTTITSINEQIVAINTSISDLKEMDAALDGYIKTLEATAADLQKQINEANAEIAKVESELGKEISALEQSLLNELNTAKEAIEAELTAINATLVELKAADAALDKKIEDLQTYVDSQLASTANWANATFSTLTQYAETQTEIATIKTNIEQTNASLAALETRLNGKIADDIKTAIDALRSELNADYVSKIENAVASVTSAYNSAISSAKEELTAAYKAAIATAIAESEAGMKAWVNEQLTQGYYDIATLDGILSALSTRLDETDADLLNQINDQKTALQQAMTELTNAYKTAITTAITENNGLIDKKISDSLQDAMNKVDAKLSQINSKIESIESRLQEIEEKLDELTKEFSITFEDYDIGISPGSSASVAYTITGATDKTTVKAMGQNGWRVQVIQSGTSKGRIKITAPNPLTDDEILVWAYDGEYRTIMSSINFVTGEITPSVDAVEVGEASGTVEVNLRTNLTNYNVSISDEGRSWLSYVGTKSFRNEAICLAYTDNRGSMRRCDVDLLDESGKCMATIAVIQKESIFNGGTQAVNLSKTETANCYIISEKGLYKFNATYKGNSQERISNAYEAVVVWESFGTEVTPNVGDLIKDVVFDEDVIYIKTADTFKEGNALVAIKDKSGEILWSWHIWLTDQPQAQIYFNDAGIMMDRNLGATSATPGDIETLGLMYQWGRKDPFLTSLSFNYKMPKSTISWPSSVQSNSTTGTIEYSIANPTTHISGNLDWVHPGNSLDNSRWLSQKTMYDPCPAGWRIPDGGEDTPWMKALGAMYKEYNDSEFDQGYNFSGDFGMDSIIWYPINCYHATNLVNWEEFGEGEFRSGLTVGADATVICFNLLGTFEGYACQAYSVRCQKE